MRFLTLAASTIALLGSAAAQAEESRLTPVSDATESETATTDFRWKDYPIDESSVMAQARAVYMILRAREAAEYGMRVVSTDAVDAVIADGTELEADAGNCRRLTRPGSLFREQRCFYESPAEAALSEFQYEMERREMEDAMARQFLETAEYEMAFRKQQYQDSR